MAFLGTAAIGLPLLLPSMFSPRGAIPTTPSGVSTISEIRGSVVWDQYQSPRFSQIVFPSHGVFVNSSLDSFVNQPYEARISSSN